MTTEKWLWHYSFRLFGDPGIAERMIEDAATIIQSQAAIIKKQSEESGELLVAIMERSAIIASLKQEIGELKKQVTA